MQNERLILDKDVVRLKLEAEILDKIKDLTDGNLCLLGPHFSIRDGYLVVDINILRDVDVLSALTADLTLNKPKTRMRRIWDAIRNVEDSFVDQVIVARAICLSRLLFENMSAFSNNLGVYTQYYEANLADYQFLFAAYNSLKSICGEETLRLHYDRYPDALKLSEHDILMIGNRKLPS